MASPGDYTPRSMELITEAYYHFQAHFHDENEELSSDQDRDWESLFGDDIENEDERERRLVLELEEALENGETVADSEVGNSTSPGASSTNPPYVSSLPMPAAPSRSLSSSQTLPSISSIQVPQNHHQVSRDLMASTQSTPSTLSGSNPQSHITVTPQFLSASASALLPWLKRTDMSSVSVADPTPYARISIKGKEDYIKDELKLSLRAFVALKSEAEGWMTDLRYPSRVEDANFIKARKPIQLVRDNDVRMTHHALAFLHQGFGQKYFGPEASDYSGQPKWPDNEDDIVDLIYKLLVIVGRVGGSNRKINQAQASGAQSWSGTQPQNQMTAYPGSLNTVPQYQQMAHQSMSLPNPQNQWFPYLPSSPPQFQPQQTGHPESPTSQERIQQLIDANLSHTSPCYGILSGILGYRYPPPSWWMGCVVHFYRNGQQNYEVRPSIPMALAFDADPAAFAAYTATLLPHPYYSHKFWVLHANAPPYQLHKETWRPYVDSLSQPGMENNYSLVVDCRIYEGFDPAHPVLVE